jgi:hypothetical protein
MHVQGKGVDLQARFRLWTPKKAFGPNWATRYMMAQICQLTVQKLPISSNDFPRKLSTELILDQLTAA